MQGPRLQRGIDSWEVVLAVIDLHVEGTFVWACLGVVGICVVTCYILGPAR